MYEWLFKFLLRVHAKLNYNFVSMANLTYIIWYNLNQVMYVWPDLQNQVIWPDLQNQVILYDLISKSAYTIWPYPCFFALLVATSIYCCCVRYLPSIVFFYLLFCPILSWLHYMCYNLCEISTLNKYWAVVWDNLWLWLILSQLKSNTCISVKWVELLFIYWTPPESDVIWDQIIYLQTAKNTVGKYEI